MFLFHIQVRNPIFLIFFLKDGIIIIVSAYRRSKKSERMNIMSKKKVFRVVGIFRAEDSLEVVKLASKYLQAGRYNRFIMGARKQDQKKGLHANELEFQRIQIDFPSEETARVCRNELKNFFVKDKSDF